MAGNKLFLALLIKRNLFKFRIYILNLKNKYLEISVPKIYFFAILLQLWTLSAFANPKIKPANYSDFKNIPDYYVRDFIYSWHTPPLNTDEIPELKPIHKKLADIAQKLTLPRDGTGVVEIIITQGRDMNINYLEGKNGKRFLFVDWGVLQQVDSDDELAYLLGQELEFGPKNLPEMHAQAKAKGVSIEDFIAYYQDEVEADIKSLVDRIQTKGYNANEAPVALRKLKNYTAHSRAGHVEKGITAYVRNLGHEVNENKTHSIHTAAKKVFGSDKFIHWRKQKGLSWLKQQPFLSTLYFEYIKDPQGFDLDSNPLLKEIMSASRNNSDFYSIDSRKHFQYFHQLSGDLFSDRELFEYGIKNYTNFAKNHDKLITDLFGNPPKPKNLFDLNLILYFTDKKSGDPALYSTHNSNYFIKRRVDILEEIEQLDDAKKQLLDTTDPTKKKTLQKEHDRIANKIQKMKQRFSAEISFFGDEQDKILKWSKRGAEILHNLPGNGTYPEEYITLDKDLRKITTAIFKKSDAARKKWAIQNLEIEFHKMKYSMNEIDHLSTTLGEIKKLLGEKEYLKQLVNSLERLEKDAPSHFSSLASKEDKIKFYEKISEFNSRHASQIDKLTEKHPEFIEVLNKLKRQNELLMIELAPDLEKLHLFERHRDTYTTSVITKDEPEKIESYLKRLHEIYSDKLSKAQTSGERVRVLDNFVVEMTRIDDLFVHGEGVPSSQAIKIYKSHAQKLTPILFDELTKHYFKHMPKYLQENFANSVMLLKYPYLLNVPSENYRQALIDLKKISQTSLREKLKGAFTFDELAEVARRAGLKSDQAANIILTFEDLIGTGGPRRWAYDEPPLRKHLIETLLDKATKDNLSFFKRLFEDQEGVGHGWNYEFRNEYRDRFFNSRLELHSNLPKTERYRQAWQDWIRTFPEDAFNTTFISNDLAFRPKIDIAVDPLNHTTQILEAYRREIARVKKGAYPKIKLDQKQIESIEDSVINGHQSLKRRFSDEMSHYVDDIDDFIKKQPNEKLAKFLVESVSFSEVDKMRGDMFQKIWKDRNNPLVSKWLLHPELVSSLPVEADRNELALWQLNERFELDKYFQKHKAGRGSTNRSNKIRPVVKKIRKIVEQQFPKLNASRNSIFEKIETRLLTSQSENSYLDKYRIIEGNWRQSYLGSNIKTPDGMLFHHVRNPIDRMEWFEYIANLSDDLPKVLDDEINGWNNTHMQKETRAEMKLYRRQYQTSSLLERSLFIHDFTNGSENFYDDPYVRKRLEDLVLGSKKNDPIFSKLFSTYFEELPSAQKNTMMSYLMSALKKSANADGLPLKTIFEAMGPFGIKSGQALRSSGILSQALQKELDDFFNRALPPLRGTVINEVESVFKQRPNVLKGVRELAGSGSVNYAVLANLEDPKTKKSILALVRIQRQNAPGQVKNENKHWVQVIKKLSEDSNEEVRLFAENIEEIRLETIDTLSEKGVEFDQSYERKAYNKAKMVYTKNRNLKTGYNVEPAKVLEQFQKLVPDEKQKLVSIFEYVPYTDWEELDPILKKNLALQVLDTELNAIFTEGIFDPDGHVGNWLVDKKNKRLVRVDYAQMREIPKEELRHIKKSLKNLFVPKYNSWKISSFAKNIDGLFDFSESPKKIDEFLKEILQSQNLGDWKSPLKRIAYIRSQLEKSLRGAGQLNMKIRLKPQTRGIISALGRLQLYRDFIPESDYLLMMAKHLPLPHGSIVTHHLTSPSSVKLSSKLKKDYFKACLIRAYNNLIK